MSNLSAVGAYLRTLREARSLSRADIATKIGSDISQIMRVETGRVDTRGSLLLALVAAVQGSADDVLQLFSRLGAGEEDGRRLAEVWLQHPDRHSSEPVAQHSPKTQLASRQFDNLTPEDLVDVIIQLGESLQEQQRKAPRPRHPNQIRRQHRRPWQRKKRAPEGASHRLKVQ